MKLQELFTEDRAVSPVIGVILMVAITVILAAVIGAFVLGLGGDTDSTPQASLSFDFDGTDTVAVEHRGGDSFNKDDTSVTINGSSVDWDTTAENRFSPGNTDTFTDTDAEDGDTLLIIHNPSDGTLARTTL